MTLFFSLLFQEALKERTREHVPQDWARTQAKLGDVLKKIGIMQKKIETLKDAKSAIQKAFDLYEQTGYSEHCYELKGDIAQIDKFVGKYRLEDE